MNTHEEILGMVATDAVEAIEAAKREERNFQSQPEAQQGEKKEFMKTKTQDPKFQIEDGYLHGQSGPVPMDEPLFILRARDQNAIKTLLDYMRHCVQGGADGEHIQAIALRLCDFTQFRNEHPDRMKKPDTSVQEMSKNYIPK